MSNQNQNKTQTNKQSENNFHRFGRCCRNRKTVVTNDFGGEWCTTEIEEASPDRHLRHLLRVFARGEPPSFGAGQRFGTGYSDRGRDGFGYCGRAVDGH